MGMLIYTLHEGAQVCPMSTSAFLTYAKEFFITSVRHEAVLIDVMQVEEGITKYVESWKTQTSNEHLFLVNAPDSYAYTE